MEERVFMMHDRGRIAEHNRDGIEAHPVPFNARTGDITTRGARDVLLLLEIDGPVRMGGFGGSARLDFYEDQEIATARDDIHFRIGAGPVIAGDDGKVHLAQIAMRQVLAAFAERRFGRQNAALTELPRPVAEFPEELAWPEAPVLSASSCHSITFPRTT